MTNIWNNWIRHLCCASGTVHGKTTIFPVVALHCVTLLFLRYFALLLTSHYVTLRHITLHCVNLRYTVSRHFALHCVTLRYIALLCVTLRYFAWHYVTLRSIASPFVTLRYFASLYVVLRYFGKLRYFARAWFEASIYRHWVSNCRSF